MGDDGGRGIIIAVVVVPAIALGVVLFLAGYAAGLASEQSVAIKAGVGRWAVDEKTGATRFVYGRAGGQ